MKMKTMILAACAAIGLTAAIAPAAHAFIKGSPHPAQHQGPYDNTAATQHAPNISDSDAPGG
jgi:hypothetical protein